MQTILPNNYLFSAKHWQLPCDLWVNNDLSCKSRGHTCRLVLHYKDVITSAMASRITSLTIVYSAVYLRTDQGKHQSSASLAFVRGIRRSPVNSPHKGPVTRKMFLFDDVIMSWWIVGYNISVGRTGVSMLWRYREVPIYFDYRWYRTRWYYDKNKTKHKNQRTCTYVVDCTQCICTDFTRFSFVGSFL